MTHCRESHVKKLTTYAGVAISVALMSLAGCTKAPTATSLSLTVTQGNCGGAWHADGGVQTFQVTNRDIQTTEVDLINPSDGGVFAEIESLAPNTTRPMHVQLGHGAYAMRCYPEDNDAVNGPTTQVTTGAAVGSPAVKPVSNLDLAGAVTAYDSYVGGGVATLSRDTAALAATLRHGTQAQAQSAWLTAHLDYNRLGAAYGAFGDFADEIDGLPDSLAGGINDPDFAGLHRIEYGLWHGQSLPSLAKLSDQLVTDVAGLRADLPKEQIDPNDLPLRAHEIMENALQFELTGDADQGSGTSLATALANVDGTQHVLDALAPVMSTRYTGWPTVATWMTTTRKALATAQRPDGTWIPANQLDDADRQGINAAVGGLLESLAPIAAIGDVRRTR
jgi:iron uptake system EfeUOB component EfeO/EfeM